MNMKNLYLGAAALLLGTVSMSAQEFGNPKDADGFYIVKWDPTTEAFAESNDWEIDETFIFAIDVTGTALETALKEASRNPDVLGRGVAYDIYTTNLVPEGGTGSSIDGRLMHIKDNVYGLTMNFYQQAVTRYKDAMFVPNSDYTDYACLAEGQVTEFSSNIFGFGWSADNGGAEWWDGVAAPIQGVFNFRSAAYTGTKTSEAYYADDEAILAADPQPFAGWDAGSYASMVAGWGGYASPKAYDVATSGINAVAVDNSPVVTTEYYNFQGQRLNNAPENGMFIVKSIKANGSYNATKVVK